MSNLSIENTGTSLIITAKIVPGSSRTVLAGMLGDMLKVKVAAAPEKGKANQCLTDFLAKKLELTRKDVTIISGHTNSVKRIELSNITERTLISKLSL